MATLTHVLIEPNAYYACISHALSIESEEIMGVLLGEWNDEDAPTIVNITSILPLQRDNKVRARDRVEVNPNHMIAAQQEAERIGARVVGWYHSHPHITVLPSHVDSRTQGSLQSLGSGFVGLIFEAFSNDPRTGIGSLNAIAFQSDYNSSNSSWEYHTIPMDMSSEEAITRLFPPKANLCSNQQASKSVQARGILALVKQLELAFKEEKEGYEESVSEDKCMNHLRKMSCCGNYQKVLAELSEASVVLCQILEDRSIFVKEETKRVEDTIASLKRDLKPEQLERVEIKIQQLLLRKPCHDD